MLSGYQTINETSEKWGISSRRVRKMCTEGRIPGTEKVGRIWMIPCTAEKPVDRRMTTGEYKHWRTKSKETAETS